MLNKKIAALLITCSTLFTSLHASGIDNDNHPFYVGVTGGWGSTTWGNLVPETLNKAMDLATPIHVNEGGGVYGLFTGYEFFPQFALEASYLRYADAKLYFDDMSGFYWDHDMTSRLITKTSRYALSAKFMIFIPHSKIRAYSSFGAAEEYRSDSATQKWRLSPIFGVGFNYDITKHVMVELGTEYVAGYGESETDPAEHFMPFLYSVYLQLAYRF